jgi:hypothetical protein
MEERYMKSSNIVIGSLFIIFGILLGISMITDIKFELWPFFVLIPGLIFEVSYFRSRKKSDPGLLVPGGILTVIGLLFFFQTLSGWKFINNSWPVFMLAVAVGLFQLYIFGGREKGLLVPVGILAGLFVIFTVSSFEFLQDYSKYIGPIIIVIVGAIIMLKGKRKKNEMPDELKDKKDDI